ncbi:MAG TPA: putative glycoside hydrolase [Opitutaceae bacterium]|nr:putative glycoside hydrolase [Opitutaceae bacterium]
MKTSRFLTFVAALATGLPSIAKEPGDFPRLLGMNIGKKIYDQPEYQRQLARLDIAILGFYKGWNPHNEADPIGSILKKIKALNPAIKLGQYTVINETYDDPSIVPNADVLAAVEDNNWWVHNAAGKKVQWTPKYHTWEINCTEWAPKDKQGRRYPEWRAERDNDWAFKSHPEFEIWYCDNVMYRPRVTGDWDGDGKDDDRNDPRIQSAYRKGTATYWAAIHRLQPKLIIMGNTDSDLSQPEFKGKLNGGFLEGWMGASYSIERRQGWKAAMDLYRTTKANLAPGGIVSVNIHGPADNYRFMRYALASCLLDDGYFSYSDSAAGYSSVLWFDEFDAPLGRAKSEPPQAAWQQGVWRRDYAGGIALVNPTDAPVTVTVESGFHKLQGKQDPQVNDGQPASRITLAAKDGIILLRDR